MSRHRRRAPWLLVLAFLFPIGASAPLACCAGVAADAGTASAGAVGSHCGGALADGDSVSETHSGTLIPLGTDSESVPAQERCCERAATDAVARHCCAGGDAFERPHAGHAPPIEVAIIGGAPDLSSVASLRAVRAGLPEPVPRLEPLYTLHSSLLI